MPQLRLELGFPVVGVVAVPATVKDRVIWRDVGRVRFGAGLGVRGVRRQEAPLSENVSELLPPVVARVARLRKRRQIQMSSDPAKVIKILNRSALYQNIYGDSDHQLWRWFCRTLNHSCKAELDKSECNLCSIESAL